jgi:hypothetical protein
MKIGDCPAGGGVTKECTVATSDLVQQDILDGPMIRIFTSVDGSRHYESIDGSDIFSSQNRRVSLHDMRVEYVHTPKCLPLIVWLHVITPHRSAVHESPYG